MAEDDHSQPGGPESRAPEPAPGDVSRRRLLSRLAGVVAAGLGLQLASEGPATAAAATGTGGGLDPVVGTWVMRVTQRGVGGFPPSFDSLASFAPGGVFIGSSPITTGTGTWTKTGDRRYGFTAVGYGSLPVGASIKLRAAVRLDDRARVLSGPFAFDVFDAGGNHLFTKTGEMSGRRMPVEPV